MRTTSTGQANGQNGTRVYQTGSGQRDKRFLQRFEINFQKSVDNKNQRRRMRLPLRGKA